MCLLQSVVLEMINTLVLRRLLPKTIARNCARQKGWWRILYLWSLVYKTGRNETENTTILWKWKMCKDLHEVVGLWQQKIGCASPDCPSKQHSHLTATSGRLLRPQKDPFCPASGCSHEHKLMWLLGIQQNPFVLQGLVFLSGFACRWLRSTQNSLQVRFAFCIWKKKEC